MIEIPLSYDSSVYYGSAVLFYYCIQLISCYVLTTTRDTSIMKRAVMFLEAAIILAKLDMFKYLMLFSSLFGTAINWSRCHIHPFAWI
jgi:hypothetical protein